jgi:tRNA A37 methylthiotransferase MiaB
MIGRTVQVLVEGESKLTGKRAAYPSTPGGVELGWEQRRRGAGDASQSRQTQLVGRTGGDQVAVFDGEAGLKGQLIDVDIYDARQMTLFARLAEVVVNAS